jgi:aminopeptidase YwaD
MTLRILLAALVATVIVSGCTLPWAASPGTPTSTLQVTPSLVPASPQPPPTLPASTPQHAPAAATSAPGTGGHTPAPVATASAASPSPPTVVAAPTVETATPSPRLPTNPPVATSTPVATATPSPTRVATPVPFSGEKAWEHVRHLSEEIGSRPSDSDAQRLAAQYIRDQFIAMGYSADLESYSFAQFRERAARVVVEEPRQVEVEARAIIYSGRGSVQEQVAFVGLGRLADFPEGGLGGKIALIERGQITFEDKVANAIARGASGVIVYNNQPGTFPASLRTAATVPAVAIGQSDGQTLRELLRQGPVVVRVAVEAATETVEGQNVVAPGPVATNRETVVIGAHYDSVDAGPGANDNASGVATMLEIARVARERSYPFDLVFVAFGDEEIGLIGSNRHVQELSPAQRGQIIGMINLDMVGVGERMQFGGTDWLARMAIESARRAGYSGSQINLPSGMSSDHASFISAGIPSVFFYRPDDPNYHTARDTAQKVQPQYLEAAGRIALDLLDQLSRRP